MLSLTIHLALLALGAEPAPAEPAPIAPAPAEAAPAAAATNTITIKAAGHLVLGTDFGVPMIPKDDALPITQALAPLFADADVALANLAAPFTVHDKPAVAMDGVDVFAFRMPLRLLPAMQALGLDVVLSANNHALDFGITGHEESMGHLDALGIGRVGHIGEVWKTTANGVTLAVVGFTQPYVPGFQSNRDHAAAAEVVRAAGRDADVVVVLVHGGGEGRDSLHVPRTREYVGREPRGKMVDFCRGMVDAGADLVLGFGAHAPRAMEIHHERLIAYALGNFLTYGPFDIQSPNHLSLVLSVTLDKTGELHAARIIPLRLRHPGVPHPDPQGWSINWLRRYSRADFPETAPDIAADGTITIPPRGAKSR